MRVKLERSFALALLVCVSLVGCKKKEAGTSAPADSSADGEAADPLAQLHALESRMQAFGLPVAAQQQESTPAGGGGATTVGGDAMTEDEAAHEAPTMAPAPSEAKDNGAAGRERDAQANYCADLCSLSESICTLEIRICELAASHGEDPVYADACERAVDDCDVAGQACDSCDH